MEKAQITMAMVAEMKFFCTRCELTWDGADCDRGIQYGKPMAYCPNCRREMSEKEESDDRD
jgi:uncharacterized OB-fold protein